MLLHEYNLCYDSIIIRLFRILLHVRAGHVGGPAVGEGDPRGGGPTSHLRLLASRPRFSFGGNSDRRTDRDGDFCWPCDLPFVALINAFQTFPLLSSSIVMSVCHRIFLSLNGRFRILRFVLSFLRSFSSSVNLAGLQFAGLAGRLAGWQAG